MQEDNGVQKDKHTRNQVLADGIFSAITIFHQG